MSKRIADSELFAWGSNAYGQLGIGGEPSSPAAYSGSCCGPMSVAGAAASGAGRTFEIPQPVVSLAGLPIARIAAGAYHSFALSRSGALFGFGRNSCATCL